MKPTLNKGEVYVGRINDEHIILLPGDHECTTWQTAMDWAKSIGGDLPNRIEQSMLWANHRGEFQRDWYWSNTSYEDDDAYAWHQIFYYGSQVITHKDNYYCRARAVRRVKVEEV